MKILSQVLYLSRNFNFIIETQTITWQRARPRSKRRRDRLEEHYPVYSRILFSAAFDIKETTGTANAILFDPQTAVVAVPSVKQW